MKLNNALKIVFIAWKDIKNPASGGAELVHQELSKRLVSDGYDVTHLVPGFKNCEKEEIIDGIKIDRVGNNILYFYLLLPFIYIFKYSRKTDLLIDCFNCFGSFCFLFSKKSIIFIHHIQDEIWWWQQNFEGVPKQLIFLINPLGYFIEKIQLNLIGFLFSDVTLTVSDSTKKELLSYGFKDDHVSVINECAIEKTINKLDEKTISKDFVVSHIGTRTMKRPKDTLEAFGYINEKYPQSKLFMLGGGSELVDLQSYVEKNKIRNVTFYGRVAEKEKMELLKQSQLLITTPVKEGWGIVVTEANSVGTPAVTYNVSGIRDSNKFGIISKENTPKSLSKTVIELVENPDLYQKIREESYEYSKNFTFDESYKSFINKLNKSIVDSKLTNTAFKNT
jgi:glycosyltransferase involved in cell wall biosynthesis